MSMSVWWTWTNWICDVFFLLFDLCSGGYRGSAVPQERGLLVVRLQGREQRTYWHDGGAQWTEIDVDGHTTWPQRQPEHRRLGYNHGRRLELFGCFIFHTRWKRCNSDWLIDRCPRFFVRARGFSVQPKTGWCSTEIHAQVPIYLSLRVHQVFSNRSKNIIMLAGARTRKNGRFI